MARSYTEEAVARRLQHIILLYLTEENMTPEEFSKRTGMWTETHLRLVHADERGETLSPRSLYAIWDALGLPAPRVEL